MPARDYSIRPVHVIGEPKSQMCAVRVKGESPSMAVGSFVDVEFGSVWATVQGEQRRIPGQWRQCEVVPPPAGAQGGGGTVFVVLNPDPRTAPVTFG